MENPDPTHGVPCLIFAGFGRSTHRVRKFCSGAHKQWEQSSGLFKPLTCGALENNGMIFTSHPAWLPLRESPSVLPETVSDSLRIGKAHISRGSLSVSVLVGGGVFSYLPENEGAHMIVTLVWRSRADGYLLCRVPEFMCPTCWLLV